MMNVVPPLEITDSKLTSSTVAEPYSGEAAWNAATNYSLGTVVVRSTTHRKYENLIAGVDAGLPESSPTRWLDVGPTNKYAMFDYDRNSQTTDASPLTVVITPGTRIGAVLLFGVDADEAEVDVSVSAVSQYNRVVDLLARGTTTWSEYFFGAFRYRPTVALLDLPMLAGAVITITLRRASGNVSCGAVIMGIPVQVGLTQYGAENDLIDYSQITRDAFGNATLVRRKTVPKVTLTVWLDALAVDKVRKLRDDLTATPAGWCGLSDQDEPYFDSVAVLGIFRRFTVQLAGPRHSLCTIELEGL